MYAEDIFLEESEVSDTKLCMVSEYSASCFVDSKPVRLTYPEARQWHSKDKKRNSLKDLQSKRPQSLGHPEIAFKLFLTFRPSQVWYHILRTNWYSKALSVQTTFNTDASRWPIKPPLRCYPLPAWCGCPPCWKSRRPPDRFGTAVYWAWFFEAKSCLCETGWQCRE